MVKAKRNAVIFYCFYLFTFTITANEISFVTEHLPPYQIKEEYRITGYATEVIQAALKHTTIKGEFTIYPWTEAYNLAKNRKNTCIYSIARTQERETLFRWSQVIGATHKHFIGLSDRNDIKINQFQDALNYQIAVLKDDVTYQLLLSKGVKAEQLIIVKNTSSLFKLLLTRPNIDLIMADWTTISGRAQFDNVDARLFKSFFQYSQQPQLYYVACNKNINNDMFNMLDKAIKKIVSNGEHNQIAKKWRMAPLKSAQ